MKVYKYCRPEHNPFNGCKTIMLGNNRTFRENYRGEGDFINDGNEGMTNGVDENGNVFWDSKINPDGMLFCTCTELLEQGIVSNSFDAAYTSRYCIIDIARFSLYILRQMANQLTMPYLYEGAVRKYILPFIQERGITQQEYLDAMEIEPFQSVVEYKELNEIKIDGVLDTVEHLKASNFNKLPLYSNQHEYRVLYVFRNALHRIFFNSALPSLIINVPDIMDYVEEC